MDPITIIVAALAAGAAAGLKSTTETAITDAYNSIKELIQRKYGAVDLTPLETKPESEVKQASVAEDLTAAGAVEDQELLHRAKALIDAVGKHDPTAAAAIGVDLEDVKAAYLKVEEVIADATGVKVHNSEFRDGIDIGKVKAGPGSNHQNP